MDQTQNSISRRMTEHLQNGALKDHVKNSHRNILRLKLKIICIKKYDNIKKHKIYKELIALKEKLSINR